MNVLVHVIRTAVNLLLLPVAVAASATLDAIDRFTDTAREDDDD